MHIVHNTKIIGIELNVNRVGEAGGEGRLGRWERVVGSG